MREREVELLAAAISKVKGHRWAKSADRSLNAFLSMKGDLYDTNQELMVVGRAVNDWRTRWMSRDSTVTAEGLALKALNDVTKGPGCPMLWVVKKWNGTSDGDPYKTRTSAFWRAAKKTIHQLPLQGLTRENWPSHLVWSDLYKIAPSTGNPGRRLRRLQFETCVNLLRVEIEMYRPKRVLFLTGLDWAAPFMKELKISLTKSPDLPLLQGVASFNGALIAIGPHPQGKKEDGLVAQISSYFSKPAVN